MKARRLPAMPWGLMAEIAMLFVIGWWIEDCLVYYVAWRDFAFVGAISKLAGKTHLGAVAAPVGAAASDVWTRASPILAAPAALPGIAIHKGYDFLSPGIKDREPVRFVVWCAGALAATFNAETAGVLCRGLVGVVVIAARALIALNIGFWLANIFRRLNDLMMAIISFPKRFYGESAPEEISTLTVETTAPIDDIEPVYARGKRNGRARRREYVQFFQGHVERIGIVLGGGGARGAYQAGALKAIHEFLCDYNALHKVKVVAGSSIGAWNAMFWVGGQVGAEKAISDDEEELPLIEAWWKSVHLADLGDLPWLYVPLVSKALLRPRPWRENFFANFATALNDALGDQPRIHFYLARTDADSGALRYATNWRDVTECISELPRERQAEYANCEVLTTGEGDPLTRTADALFGALDLAPLFARTGEEGADGADLLERLPLGIATELEACDLLFVLPLNCGANVAAEWGVGGSRHFARILGAHKAAIERAQLREIDATNQFAQRIERIEFGLKAMATASPPEGVAAEAYNGLQEEIAEFNFENRMRYVFTTAPAGRVELGAGDFWKGDQLRDAFDLMYLQTKRELYNRFFEDIEPEDPQIVMVDGAIPEIDALPKPVYRRPSEL